MEKKLILKTGILVCMLVGALAVHAQKTKNSGHGFAYKAVLRSPQGILKANEQVELRFGLYTLEVDVPNWLETHSVTTDGQGVVSVRVGKGDMVSAAPGITAFNQLDFEHQGRWLKVELKDGDTWKTISFEETPSAPMAYRSWSSIYPAGSIMPFAGSDSDDNIPVGWMKCDGRELARLEYPGLYSAIGGVWGYDTATDKFRIPDLRGRFLMGANDDNGNNSLDDTDIGAGTLGTYLDDGFVSHYHLVSRITATAVGIYGVAATDKEAETGVPMYSLGGTTTRTTGATGGSESRPKNVYVHYIIKY
ncbi:MAG: phage tail protein [Prevotella sp.]|nr:phage tail protein [Prevotella sp.]